MHGETIRVQGGDDVVIRNNVFKAGSDAGSGNVFVTNTSDSDSNKAVRLRMEGNTLEPVIGSYAIQVVSTVNRIDVSAWTVRNNRFDQAPLFMGASPPAPCGNTGQVPTSWTATCP
jgi:hypothetical protein